MKDVVQSVEYKGISVMYILEVVGGVFLYFGNKKLDNCKII